MRSLFRLLLILAATLGFVSSAAAAAKPDLLILLSIDGFRADYLTHHKTPVIQALADQGLSAAMRPSFPSLTFPNHYTLVTGLYPDHHGIVANSFEDARRPGAVFTMASKDEAWWNQALPLWITAERQGLKTGEMFWPGSEVAFAGTRPSYWAPYDKTLPEPARVDRLLGWLDLPPDRRPRFLTLYFEAVDTAGHAFGPDSPEVDAAIARVDAAIGRLMGGLKARGVAADLIVVSDHGMSEVPPGHTLLLDRLTDLAAVHVAFGGVLLGVDVEALVGQGVLGRPDEGADRAAGRQLQVIEGDGVVLGHGVSSWGDLLPC